MHLLVIINPHASCVANIQPETLAEKIKAVAHRWAGVTCEVMISESADAMRENLARKLAQHRIDRVVSAGGDGTLMEMLPVMQHHPEIPLAILPLGTGNLLAYNLGIPFDMEGALAVAIEGTTRRIDLGRINDTYFVLNCSIGVDAEIMQKTDRTFKRRVGRLAYFITGIRVLAQPVSARVRIVADGKPFVTRAIGVNVSSLCLRVPGGLTLAPQGKCDDNLLHGTIFNVQTLIDYLIGILQMILTFWRPRAPVLKNFDARTIEIDSDPPLITQADGNVIGKTPARIELVDDKLLLCVPRG